MKTASPVKTLTLFLVLVVATIFLSTVSAKIWGGKPETVEAPTELVINSDMTVKNFGQTNGLENPVLKQIFGLQQKSDLQKPLSEFGSDEKIRSMVIKKMALSSEHASKPWKKIAIKFPIWFAFMAAVFFLARKRVMTNTLRMSLLAGSVAIFGVALGADPSPMGTVKDAVHLLGTTGAVFPPRLIALTVFLLIVFLANKFICGWGCQAGTLQDLIFRLNRNEKHEAVVGRQIKIPFSISNGIRIAFFILFTVGAFAWAIDIIGPIDPFKIFKPMHLGVTGAVFVGLLLTTSLFVYRPWCHLFCPFGLVGWFVEKVSLVKVRVDYDSCIGCEKCVKACPNMAMESILKQDKTVSDCFSCYSCREACPSGAVTFSKGRRQEVPAGHFEKNAANRDKNE